MPYSLNAVNPRCSVKKVFLKISQNSKENTDAGVSFLTNLEVGGMAYLNYIQLY